MYVQMYSILNHCIPIDNIDLMSRTFLQVSIEILSKNLSRYYSLAACAALLKYFEFSHNIYFAPGALKIGFSGAVQSMLLDSHTVRNLELLENARDVENRGGSLLGLLNRTCTFGGARLLRASIMQPPTGESRTTLHRSLFDLEMLNQQDSPLNCTYNYEF